jgi:hypothetical protein
MKSTSSGKLNDISQCKVSIPGGKPIIMNNLPEISDSKSANYNNEGIIGRSFPLYTYYYSGDRVINMQMHFFIVQEGDAEKNLNNLRLIQSAVYPRPGSGGAPFAPPPVCQIECGQLLGNQALCVILTSYSVKFPTEVAWDENLLVPFRFDVDTSWLTVYTSSDLPENDRIISSGR